MKHNQKLCEAGNGQQSSNNQGQGSSRQTRPFFAVLFCELVQGAALHTTRSAGMVHLGAINGTLNGKEPFFNDSEPTHSSWSSGVKCLNRDEDFQHYCCCPWKRGELPQPMGLELEIALASLLEEGICSQFWQDYVLSHIFKKIGTKSKFFVEFGARQPQMLNSAHFRLNCDWQGLLMDAAPGEAVNGACPHCADVKRLLNAPDEARVRLRQAFVTKDNVNDVFTNMKVPTSFDLLTVDIDGMDYWVMKGLDTHKFRPRVVALEYSSYFNRDEPYVPKYNPKFVWRDPWVTGSSLVALDDLMRSRGYSYVGQVAGEHAIWVANSELHEKDRGTTTIPYRIEEGWQSKTRSFDPDDFQKISISKF